MPSVHGKLTSYTIIVINLKIHNYALHKLINYEPIARHWPVVVGCRTTASRVVCLGINHTVAADLATVRKKTWFKTSLKKRFLFLFVQYTDNTSS